MPDYTPTSNYYIDKDMPWTSYDQVPYETWNSRGTGYLPTSAIDLIISHNRGDTDYDGTSRPSVTSRREQTGYGANEGPTMGIQPGGVGSIPGADWSYNQLMALSRAKNAAIDDQFGSWGEWADAGYPDPDYAGLPTKEDLGGSPGGWTPPTGGGGGGNPGGGGGGYPPPGGGGGGSGGGGGGGSGGGGGVPVPGWNPSNWWDHAPGQISGESRIFAPHGAAIGEFSAPRTWGGAPRSTGPGGVPGGWYTGQAALANALRG